MNFLKSLKDMVIVDDVKPTLPPTKNAPPPMPAVQPAVGQAVPMAAVESGLDTTNVEAQIEQIITSQAGFAQFSAFKAAVDNLASVIPDEGTRFKAAAATTGLTQAALLGSVEVYKAVLEGETANFNATFVAQAEQNIQSLNDQSASIVAQIGDLTKQLAELSDKKTELTKNVTGATASLAKAKIDFSSVTNTISNRYAELTLKLQQYVSA